MKRRKKLLRLTNFIASVFTSRFPNFSDKDLFSYLKRTNIFSYFIFQREYSESKKEHWQCYFECLKPQYLSKLQKVFRTSHLEPRIGTQAEAIGYCSKENSRVFPKQMPLIFGKPKDKSHTFRNSAIVNQLITSAHPSTKINKSKKQDVNREQQWLDIEKGIENGYYLLVEDVKKDYPYLTIHHWEKIKDLINRHNPSPMLPSTAKIYWLYGRSGAGKTTYTYQFLKQRGYLDKDVCIKKSPHGTAPHFWFDKYDADKKVLWIEEVRENFPNRNQLIQLIDRRDFLETKGGHIRNRFDLIVINSLLPPWKIYRLNDVISPAAQAEVLRRIFEGKIIKIVENSEQLDQLKKEKLTALEFVERYAPHIEVLTVGEDRNLYRKYLGYS